MKKIFSVFIVIIAIISGTPLSAQNFYIQDLQVPFVYHANFFFEHTKDEEVENNIMTDTVYEPGTLIKSFVDSRSNGFSGFPAGSCTEYIARQRPELFVNPDGSRRMTGNAEDRLRNAQRIGLATGKIPKEGSIAVYYEGKGARKYGHVAYVEQIQENGTLIVSEMNYEQEYIVTWRVLKAQLAAGYIY